MVDISALSALCAKVEALAPGAIAGMTISNIAQTHIERALFPTLPFSFSAAITHVPLQPADFGSCVKAISRGEPITCPDIVRDTLFDPRWRQVCLDHGLQAIQSRPVYVDGQPRGTFVLAYRHPKPEFGMGCSLDDVRGRRGEPGIERGGKHARTGFSGGLSPTYVRPMDRGRLNMARRIFPRPAPSPSTRRSCAWWRHAGRWSGRRCAPA